MKLQLPDGCGGVFFREKEWTPDKHGTINIDDVTMADLDVLAAMSIRPWRPALPEQASPKAVEAVEKPRQDEPVPMPTPVLVDDIDSMGKDELIALARDKYGVVLDKRKSVPKLRSELAAIIDGQ